MGEVDISMTALAGTDAGVVLSEFEGDTLSDFLQYDLLLFRLQNRVAVPDVLLELEDVNGTKELARFRLPLMTWLTVEITPRKLWDGFRADQVRNVIITRKYSMEEGTFRLHGLAAHRAQ